VVDILYKDTYNENNGTKVQQEDTMKHHNIRAQMLKAGITIEHLSQETKIPVNTLSRKLLGKSKGGFYITEAAKIMRVIPDITFDDFLTNSTNEQK
jgi:lambda repressor-like predicted transcriptional regulator